MRRGGSGSEAYSLSWRIPGKAVGSLDPATDRSLRSRFGENLAAVAERQAVTSALERAVGFLPRSLRLDSPCGPHDDPRHEEADERHAGQRHQDGEGDPEYQREPKHPRVGHTAESSDPGSGQPASQRRQRAAVDVQQRDRGAKLQRRSLPGSADREKNRRRWSASVQKFACGSRSRCRGSGELNGERKSRVG